MGKEIINEFRSYREKMNERLLDQDNKIIKRIYNLDANAYKDGALKAREKEMLGLVSSMVLRCDDCIRYHLEKCFEAKLNTEEILEIFRKVPISRLPGLLASLVRISYEREVYRPGGASRAIQRVEEEISRDESSH